MKKLMLFALAGMLALLPALAPAEELPLLEVVNTPEAAPPQPLEDGTVAPEEAVAAEAYLTGAMVECINQEAGFSIQYPALFPEDKVEITSEGISGTAQDCAFHARVVPKDGRTFAEFLESCAAGLTLVSQQEDEVTGTVQWIGTDGKTQYAWILMEGEVVFYEALLSYPEAQAETFAPYVQYMTYSFSADEMGIG